MWNYLRWRLFGTATIICVMYDGRHRLGIARKFGNSWHGTPWSFAINSYRLHESGGVSGDQLVVGWEPVTGNIPFKPEAV